MWSLTIGLADSSEARALTDLALAAKASRGYSPEFMAACRDELTITEALLARWTVWVARVDTEICGMIALDSSAGAGQAEVEDFFVAPGFQGRGVGRALMATLLHECRSRGARVIGLDADPFAESLYHRFGFKTVGRSQSKSIPGRTLPRMELQI